MKRPYIICHMMQSVDGRVACDMVDKISGEEYYDALASLDCQADVEGKHSYQIHYCGFDEFSVDKPEPISQEEFFVASRHNDYKVSVDTRGTLLWENVCTDNHICIVSELVSRQYLDYLKSKGISYIAVGKYGIDLSRAMEILHSEFFNVNRVAVVGGGKINGGFLKAGLIDELSVMIAPGIDGRIGQPALFDGVLEKEDFLPCRMIFKEVKLILNGVIWARYNFENDNE